MAGSALSEELLAALQSNSRSHTNLSLSRSKLDDNDALRLSIALASNSCVTILDLKSNNIGPEGAERLSTCLIENPTLTHLDLENNILGADGLQHIASSLRQNRVLSHLDLANQWIGQSGVAALAAALETNTALRHLGLAGTSVGEEGADFLSGLLGTNRALQHLDLAGNGIGARGAAMLAAGLEVNQSLLHLVLKGNNIGDSGAEKLSAAWRRNSALKHLSVAYNNITDTGVDALRGAALSRKAVGATVDLRGNAPGSKPGADGVEAVLTSTAAAPTPVVAGPSSAAAAAAAAAAAPPPPAAPAPPTTTTPPPTTTTKTAKAAAMANGTEAAAEKDKEKEKKTGDKADKPAGKARAKARASVANASGSPASSPGAGSPATPVTPRKTLAADPAKASAELSADPVKSGQQFDEIMDNIETFLKAADLAQNSAVRLRKAEIDLLSQFEIINELLRLLLKKNNRTLLRDVFAGNIVRIARLRAALTSVKLSDMNARDGRLPAADAVCSAVEDILAKDLGLNSQVATAVADSNIKLMVSRASLISNPNQTRAFRASLSQISLPNITPSKEDSHGLDLVDEEDDDEDEDVVGATRSMVSEAGDRTPRDLPPPMPDTEVKAADLFQQLDTDRKGRVVVAELKIALLHNHSLMKSLHMKNYQQTSQLLKEVDADRQRDMDFPEFMAYLGALRKDYQNIYEQQPTPQFDPKIVANVFHAMDEDGDGVLNSQELRSAYAGILLSAGETADPKRIARWAKRNLKKFDTSSKSGLNLEEFSNLLKNSRALAPVLSAPEPVAAVKDNSAAVRSNSRAASRSAGGEGGSGGSAANRSKGPKRGRSRGAPKAAAPPSASGATRSRPAAK